MHLHVAELSLNLLSSVFLTWSLVNLIIQAIILLYCKSSWTPKSLFVSGLSSLFSSLSIQYSLIINSNHFYLGSSQISMPQIEFSVAIAIHCRGAVMGTLLLKGVCVQRHLASWGPAGLSSFRQSQWPPSWKKPSQKQQQQQPKEEDEEEAKTAAAAAAAWQEHEERGSGKNSSRCGMG